MKQEVSGYDNPVHPYEFSWRETDPAHPALDVMIRLIGLDDEAPFPLKHTGDGLWTGVAELPDGLRSGYQICPVRDFRVPPSGLDEDGRAKVFATGTADPANPNTIGPVYGNSEQASILELPGALPQPWFARRPSVARGTVREFSFDREWPATVHVYTPPQPHESLPVVVLFDAQAWVPADVTATFDNLIADGVVPPFMAAMAGYPFGPTRVRGLTRPAVHLRYLVDELMPWLVRDFHATTDPARTVLIGQSLGGLAAVNTALREPARFGNVLSQSGSFWWPGGGDGELSGAEVIAAAASSSVAVRFWLEAGACELGLVEGNRELHAALTKQGRDVSYREYQGGHDFACWRGGIGDGLAALLSN